MLPSNCLYVSRATPTTISNPVPPIETVVGKLVKFENKIGIPAIISSASDSLWISDDLYKLFKNVILKEAIEERDCRLLYMEENEYIKCYQTVIGATYSLIINEHNFTFSSEIFDKNRYGIIKSNKNQHNHKAHNFTGIIIGPQFLSQFNYSI